MRYYLGPYEPRHDEALGDYLATPDGCVAMVRLVVPERRADSVLLCVTPDDVRFGADYRQFAQGDIDAVPRESDRSVFASALGLGTVTGDTIADWAFDVAWRRGTPDGSNGIHVALPTQRRRCRLRLNRLIERRLSDVDQVLIFERLRYEYRILRAASIERGNEHYRKVLGGWCAQYRRDEATFIPDDLPRETKLRPETTIGDTFTDTTGTQLDAHTATGPNGGFDWTEFDAQDAEISASDTLTTTTDGINYGRADSALSSADHYSQASAEAIEVGGDTNGEAVGVCCRYSASANTNYLYYLSKQPRHRVFEVTAGSLSQLGSTSTTAFGTFPFPFKLECDGNDIVGSTDGADEVTTSDATLGSNVRAGCAVSQTGNSGAGEIDDFEAADLAAGATPDFPFRLYYHQGAAL